MNRRSTRSMSSAEKPRGPTTREAQRRAQELVQLGDSVRAAAITDCSCSGVDPDELNESDACCVRACPFCASNLALRLHATVWEELSALRSKPRFVIHVNVRCKHEPTWRDAWKRLRRSLTRLREILGYVRTIGVVFLDTEGDKRVVRAELVVAAPTLDEKRLTRRWDIFTAYRGTLSVEDVTAMGHRALAKRLTDRRRWTPQPGALTLPELSAFLEAMRLHRWKIDWEGRRSARRTRTK